MCFCNDDTVSQPLHSVTTFDVNHRVRRIATEHEDTLILAKLRAGDMIMVYALAKIITRIEQAAKALKET